MELHNVQINAAGPACLIKDSKDLELNGVATRRPQPTAPVVRLDHCPGAIVRNSRSFTGTNVFLQTAPGELKTFILEGNVNGGAKKATEEKLQNFWQVQEPPTEAN